MNHTNPTAVVARIRQMADYWEQHLPEVIRTPAVVSALRAALEPAAASAVVAPPTSRAAEELAKCVTRAIWALKSPPPPGSQHYRSGWDDGLEAAIDAARDEVLRRLAVEAHGTGTGQQAEAPTYPHPDGDVTVLGPEVFASNDGTVISWRGENYVRQEPAPVAQQPAADGDEETRPPCIPDHSVPVHCPGCDAP